jgi:2-keto-4-pentenoate hydratase/2-oxohepta-3-ene-1,7-dioic acid hydratase in catechol pathway
MRIARIATADGVMTCVAVAGGWLPVHTLGFNEDPTELLAESESVRKALEALGDSVAADVVDGPPQLPLGRTGKILAVGLNYHDHVREIGAVIPSSPLLFGKFPSSLTGPYETIEIDPAITSQVDYEVELGAVVAQRGRDIPLNHALAHVGGYVTVNDVSARDIQFAETQWIRSKSFDGFCPVGPWIATPDEIDHCQSLALTTTVNGVTRQSSTTAEMIYTVADLVSRLSAGTTLEPGDLILTGTPPGVAMGMPDPQWIRPGDVVRCEVVGLGHTQNRFAASNGDAGHG